MKTIGIILSLITYFAIFSFLVIYDKIPDGNNLSAFNISILVLVGIAQGSMAAYFAGKFHSWFKSNLKQ